jgi:hypothetical protein
MNWGHKILFVYIAFVAAMLFLVLKASSQKDDLVTQDYYGQELKYQQRIDETERTNALSAALQCVYKEGMLVISFPGDFSGKAISGNALLYCPSDEGKDIKQDFMIKDNALEVAIPNNYKGAFELHINWQSGGQQYYYEKKIFI